MYVPRRGQVWRPIISKMLTQDGWTVLAGRSAQVMDPKRREKSSASLLAGKWAEKTRERRASHDGLPGQHGLGVEDAAMGGEEEAGVPSPWPYMRNSAA